MFSLAACRSDSHQNWESRSNPCEQSPPFGPDDLEMCDVVVYMSIEANSTSI